MSRVLRSVLLSSVGLALLLGLQMLWRVPTGLVLPVVFMGLVLVAAVSLLLWLCAVAWERGRARVLAAAGSMATLAAALLTLGVAVRQPGWDAPAEGAWLLAVSVSVLARIRG